MDLEKTVKDCNHERCLGMYMCPYFVNVCFNCRLIIYLDSDLKIIKGNLGRTDYYEEKLRRENEV